MTTPDAKPSRLTIRVGEGWDTHALVPGRRLILGGVEIPYERGLMGHSRYGGFGNGALTLATSTAR